MIHLVQMRILARNPETSRLIQMTSEVALSRRVSSLTQGIVKAAIDAKKRLPRRKQAVHVAYAASFR